LQHKLSKPLKSRPNLAEFDLLGFPPQNDVSRGFREGLDVIKRVHRRRVNKGISRIDPLDTDSDGLDQQCPAATHPVRALAIESREEPKLSQKARR